MSVSLPSDPAPLGRPAAVVGLRGDVGDGADLEAGGGEGTDRGLAARTPAPHEDVDLLHAVLLRLAGAVLGGHLRRERRRLARALEPDVPGRGPADHVALRVGDRHDRVVEGALDVRLAVRDVLLFLAADLLDGRLARLTRHYWPPAFTKRPQFSAAKSAICVVTYFLPAFFLPAMVFFGPLRVRALVLVRCPWTGRPRRCRIPS